MGGLDRSAIVQVSCAGCQIAKGIVTDIRGYRIRVSILNRKDRTSPLESAVKAGSGVELSFRGSDLPPTPLIGGRVKSMSANGTETALDVEITEWDKLALYWRHASEGQRERS